MAFFKVIIQATAERELRAAPFPFRRQIVQAIHKLKNDPRPPERTTIDADFYSLPVHGWRVVYGVDERALAVTVFRIVR